MGKESSKKATADDNPGDNYLKIKNFFYLFCLTSSFFRAMYVDMKTTQPHENKGKNNQPPDFCRQKGSAMYAIASNLVGLPSSTLRVRIVRDVADCYEVVTADLLDAGTRLMLSKSKVALEGAPTSTLLSHKDGLVGFIVD